MFKKITNLKPKLPERNRTPYKTACKIKLAKNTKNLKNNEN